jgi:hypothetical protein
VQKGFIPVFILLAALVFIIGGAFYFGRATIHISEFSDKVIIPTAMPTASSVSKEVSNWKTFTSSGFNFSIQYPSEWVAEEIEDSHHIAFGLDSVRDKGSKEKYLTGTIQLLINKIGNTTIAQHYQMPELRYMTPKTVGDHQVFEVHHSACVSQGDCVTVAFKQGEWLFEFSTTYDSEAQKYLPTIYQMISTMKFSDRPQTNQLETWCSDLNTHVTLKLSDALKVAQNSDCGKLGTLSQTAQCSGYTGTWWIDWTAKSPKSGCNPACVVNVNNQKSEINWRCTGLNDPSN